MKPTLHSISPETGSITPASSAKRLFEQRLVGRVLVDILQHHPAAAFLDPPDRVLDRKAGMADLVGIDAVGQVARIIFDARARQPLAELDQRFEGQQGMAEQAGAPACRAFPDNSRAAARDRFR